MLKDKKYICFDFETTGLDIQKDEPIQIGIIQFDKSFQIQKHFQSYIKPQKDIKKLKKIVSFITDLNIKDLENAPTIDQIIPKIKDFFDNEPIIIIGHNIKFDIQILKKYYKLNNYTSIDTYNLSKTLLHFISSYSLEIINKILDFDKKLKEIQEKQNLNLNLNGQAHDGLYDSIASYNLFKFSINKIQNLIQKYPIISHYISKSNSIYKNILKLPKYKLKSEQKLFLPPINQKIKQKQKVYAQNSYDINKYDRFQKFFIGNQNISELLPKLLNPNKKYILAFNNYHKLGIIEKQLKDNNIKNISHLNQKPNLDPDKIEKFLNQPSLEDFEVNFILKYYSQYDQNYSLLDLNNYEDYKIFNLLKQTQSQESLSRFILTTHDNLLKKIQNTKLQEYTILFFDWDWWYHSFKNQINQPFDLYYIIYFLGKLKYKQKVLYTKNSKEYKYIHKFDSFFQIFAGVLFIELIDKFKGNSHYKIQINPIIDNIEFYKTNKLRKQLKTNLNKLKQTLEKDDYKKLKNMIITLYKLLNNIVQVQQKMYDKDKFYFIFHHTNNVINYQTFLDNFENYQIYFFTNQTKKNSYILNEDKKLKEDFKIITIKDLQDIKKYTKKYSNIYILSLKRKASKNLFNYIVDEEMTDKYDLLVQNITGGHGKNIHYGKNSKQKIMIGNQGFYYNCISKGIKFDKILTYKTTGSLQEQIFNDIKYYTKGNK